MVMDQTMDTNISILVASTSPEILNIPFKVSYLEGDQASYLSLNLRPHIFNSQPSGQLGSQSKGL